MYTPTKLDGFDIEAGEKVFKPGMVSANLGLISQETKQLADMIASNLARILQNAKQLDDQITSHSKLFLDIN